MSLACSAPPASGFVSSMTGYIDCQAEVLGSGAWSALAASGSSLMIVLTGFLTIFIALIGYNLLLGSAFTVRSATLAFVKIGAVFALATSWPAYRTLIYDVVTHGPAQLVSEIGTRSGIPGSDGTLVQRLDLADSALVQLAVRGAGMAPANAYENVPPPPFIGFDSFALGGSRILFLLTSVAALGAVRVVAGLLLALGPFFIAFLLFDGTRSLFEGWVRVLGGAALGAVTVSITLGLELGLLEPWLSSTLARRMAGEALPSMPTELFTIICLFATLVAASLYAALRLTSAFRIPAALRLEWAGISPPHDASTSARSERSPESRDVERSRAAAMASLLTTRVGREHANALASTTSASWSERSTSASRPAAEQVRQHVPLGRSYSRRPGSRVSAIASKRDSNA